MDKRLLREETVETRIPEGRIHPDLRAAAAQFAPTHIDLDLLVANRHRSAGMPPAKSTDSVIVSEEFVPGPPGAPDVHVRVFAPTKRNGPVGALLWIHGGGYIYQLMEMDDPRCMRFALESNCVVVSVDYRVAPENPYPAPLDDCYAALGWLWDEASNLGVDRSRIAVSGGSAGGGLAAALSLLARDRGGPRIAFQALLCPMIDDSHTTNSSIEITDRRFWCRQGNITCWSAYLGELSDDEVPIYAAPSRAEDLSGLPPAYIFVGELDMFRDESAQYAERLMRAGVMTEYHVFPGCFHGFEVFADGEISKRANAETVSVLRCALEKK